MMIGNIIEWIKTVKLWCTLKKSNEKNIFITGAPRSGTTLIKTVIQSHSKVCGPPSETCGVFEVSNIYKSINKNGLSRKVNRDIIEEAKSIIEVYDRCTSRMKNNCDAEITVDKAPWPPTYRFRLPYVVSKFPKSKWVHIVRDGRDCFCSAKNHPYLSGITKTCKKFAKRWSKIVSKNEKIPKRKRITIKYEKLVKNTEYVTKKVMNFLGLGREKNQLKTKTRERYDDGPEGVHSRLKKPIDSSSVGRWKKEMEKGEAKKFEYYAESELKKMGYESIIE